MIMKTIGIIGGMGSLATVDLFRKIVTLTQASSDNEHIHVYIDSNTDIPDRTKAILHGGLSPVPEMVKSAKKLQSIGADCILISCNTAHYYFDDVAKAVDIPVLNMLNETAKYVKGKGIGTVGLLATDGTCETGIYDKAFKQYGINFVKPSKENQKHVMDVIYKGVKAGKMDFPLDGFYKTLLDLKEAGAQCFALGCTELPLAFEIYHIHENTVDPTEVLTISAIHFVGKKSIYDD